MTYVISNIHGYYEEFKRLLEIIRFNNTKDELYILGDLVDYGPDSIELINDISLRLNVYCIAGEHDFQALKCMQGYEEMMANKGKPDPDFVEEMTDWINDGGQPTMDAYRKLDADSREGIRDYLEDMPLYEEIQVKGQDYLLVHQGIYDFTPNLELDELEPNDFFTEAIDPTAKYFDDKTIIAGHTPTSDDNGGDNRIFYGNGSILIDCGQGRGGRLACLRLDDGKEFYV